MKKVFFIAVVLGVILAAGTVFAGDTFVVQSVTGKVEREVSPGKWEAVTVGADLTATTVVNTGLNSSLVLKEGTRTITIKAMQKGSVEKLAAATVTSGVRIGGKVSDSAASTASARNTSSLSTASTRASDAAGDVQWEE
ncbi:MAG: hypothetical protein LBQ57_01880 [Spirochaetales bacterium]|jgi:hypothetical protein|nr:hypothetical protein [Spirochaetales bacterium]